MPRTFTSLPGWPLTQKSPSPDMRSQEVPGQSPSLFSSSSSLSPVSFFSSLSLPSSSHPSLSSIFLLFLLPPPYSSSSPPLLLSPLPLPLPLSSLSLPSPLKPSTPFFYKANGEDELPSGWERRRDAGTGRFFYIDHNTRTTHWVSTRPKNTLL